MSELTARAGIAISRQEPSAPGKAQPGRLDVVGPLRHRPVAERAADAAGVVGIAHDLGGPVEVTQLQPVLQPPRVGAGHAEAPAANEIVIAEVEVGGHTDVHDEAHAGEAPVGVTVSEGQRIRAPQCPDRIVHAGTLQSERRAVARWREPHGR